MRLHLNNANMQLSLLALVVIPELRISDKGLVDVTQFEVIPVVELRRIEGRQVARTTRKRDMRKP